MCYHFICIYCFSQYRLEAYSNGVVTHCLETGFLDFFFFLKKKKKKKKPSISHIVHFFL
jgi:hypothetical protein